MLDVSIIPQVNEFYLRYACSIKKPLRLISHNTDIFLRRSVLLVPRAVRLKRFYCMIFFRLCVEVLVLQKVKIALFS